MTNGNALRRTCYSLTALLVTSSCGRGEVPLDSRNPMHCGVAFAVLKSIAETKKPVSAEQAAARPQLIKDMSHYMEIEAVAARSLPADQRKQSDGEQIASQLIKDLKVRRAFVKQCLINLER
ncbi:MAG: hypothetical protein JWL96_4225 [Sphingomonas bacterium]|nr:hypothetical protein [Sphingomonas bacterium]